MKLLVIGWYYSTNLGDAALCDCVAALLRSRFPRWEIQIRDLAGRKEFLPEDNVSLVDQARIRRRQKLRILATCLGWDRQLHSGRWHLKHYRENLDALGSEPCDGVVFAGGELFMDSLGLYVETLTRRFCERGIPVFFNACGVGPSWSRGIQRRLGQALTLPNVKLLSCRDDCPRLAQWCGKPEGFVTPTADPALAAGQVYGVTKDPEAQTLGLGILYPKDLSPRRVLTFWQQLIRLLEQKRIPWRLFTNGSGVDAAFARELIASMPELTGPEESYLCPRPRTPRELTDTIARFRGLISFRLHSHILATSLGIPTVALVWDEKVPFFFQKIGHPERCLSPYATAKEVLAAWTEAEKTGYPQERIARQRQHAQALLAKALISELGE